MSGDLRKAACRAVGKGMLASLCVTLPGMGLIALAAAYALYEKREALRRENSKKNAEHSWHSMKDGAGGEYYSPSEVRSMSQKEVHKNYKKIIESMKHWK